MGLISVVPIEYMTFSDRRLPKIGVYYLFGGSSSMGICKEFNLDIGDVLDNGDEVVSVTQEYFFSREDEVLAGAERHDVQAIRTKVFDGVSFLSLAHLISDVHYREFLVRHDWLKKN